MFSPYYRSARARAHASAEDHCALNVVLYGRDGFRWVLSEYGHRDVERESDAFRLAGSVLRWRHGVLEIDVDERCAPFPARLRGQVRIEPAAIVSDTFVLDSDGAHRWHPLAPVARAHVELDDPGARWTGHAYMDTNSGDTPLEAAFDGWTWSRSRDGDRAVVLYDVCPIASAPRSISLSFEGASATPMRDRSTMHELPRSRWGIARATRTGEGGCASVLRTWSDTPFYARSLLRLNDGGRVTTAIHESLDLRRFRSAWVQRMLPFRMRRR